MKGRETKEAKREVKTIENPPDAFICPIKGEIFRDPVMAVDGHTYERKAIEKWWLEKLTSPQTNEVIESKHLTPNWTLKKSMEEILPLLQEAEKTKEQLKKSQALLKDASAKINAMHEVMVDAMRELKSTADTLQPPPKPQPKVVPPKSRMCSSWFATKNSNKSDKTEVNNQPKSCVIL